MKHPFLKFIIPLLATFWLPSAQSEIIFQDDFENGLGGWDYVGEDVHLDNGAGVNGGNAVRIDYFNSGTAPYTFRKNVGPEGLSEVYVKFHFRTNITGGGAKFLKLFGKRNSPEGYANSTLMLNYDSGRLKEISYGNGSGTANDTQQTINYGGNIKNDSGPVVVHSTSEADVSDNRWRTYELHMKYNDNGKRNGVYRIWIDGELKLHVTNVKNRHDNNSKEFSLIELAGYSKGGAPSPWKLWYDNLVISTQPIGGGEPLTPLPKAPTLIN